MPAKADRDKFLTEDEFRRLLAIAKGTGSPSLRGRNYLLICLAGNLGLRISEATDVRLDDCQLDGRHPFIRVHTRKSGTLSDLPLDERLVAVIRPYLRRLGKQALERRRGKPSESALLSAKGRICLFPGDKGPTVPLSIRAASKLFKILARRAGLRPAVLFHSLRHYRGIQLYRSTGDLNAVKRLLRHSSIFSVAHYQHLVEDETEVVKKTKTVL